jgi:hypothetical protein
VLELQPQTLHGIQNRNTLTTLSLTNTRMYTQAHAPKYLRVCVTATMTAMRECFACFAEGICLKLSVPDCIVRVGKSRSRWSLLEVRVRVYWGEYYVCKGVKVGLCMVEATISALIRLY